MKEKLRLFGMLLPLLLVLTVTGCFYDEGVDVSIPDDTIVSYTKDIQPIFNANCTSCHPLVVASPDLTDTTSYEVLTTNSYVVPQDLEASILYQRLIGNPNVMPPSGALAQENIELVKAWIEQGALNN